jgi:hypothetical protein
MLDRLTRLFTIGGGQGCLHQFRRQYVVFEVLVAKCCPAIDEIMHARGDAECQTQRMWLYNSELAQNLHRTVA